MLVPGVGALFLGLLMPVEWAETRDGIEAAEQAIDADGMLAHIRVLASDEFEGRGPATEGEEKTVAYLSEQMRRVGLQPGNPDGTYVQHVPLVGIRTEARGVLRAGGEEFTLATSDAWVPVSRRQVSESVVEGSPVLFVGYGIEAPEYGWDDYAGVDARGKALVMLVGDPPVPDPDDPARLDPKMFQGRAMTYYGRWTYKYEMAAQKGAAAVLLIHETGAAGYPYSVVLGSWGRENFEIPSADAGAGRAVVEAWISSETAERLFTMCGKNLSELKAMAVQRGFRAVELNARFDARVQNTLRTVRSRNVIGRLEGSDPNLRHEYVVYTAHWDHLGRDPQLEGDQIYNGAADNASGVAMMLEIAEAWGRLETKPKRSVLFLAVTAEETGLLGSRFYAENPLYPIESTLANINMDVINLWGKTTDLTSVGMGHTTLDDLLTELARKRGRSVGPDLEPEKGMYYRSDHFEFAKVGVPALNAKGGNDYIGKPADFAKTVRDTYTRDDYHKVSDEVKPGWDLSGAVDDARLLFELGVTVASGSSPPAWKESSEFHARRPAR